MGQALPTGLLSNHRIDTRLRRQFAAPGRSNDFRQLKRKLELVATDLDNGESAPFGQPGFDHVPISEAVQASVALPDLFPPVAIDGRHYVDGALKKTLHASVLLDEGLDLLICLNPLVSFDASASTRHRVLAGAEARIPRLVDGGLPVVLAQTFRTLIHSRLELGMKGYELSPPDTTILLFEPDPRDPQMFLASTFSYAQRCALAEHAYQRTRQMLGSRRAAARSAGNWRATACSPTTRCSTTHNANCCPAPRLPGAARAVRAVRAVHCGVSKRCSTTWKTRWPRGRRRLQTDDT